MQLQRGFSRARRGPKAGGARLQNLSTCHQDIADAAVEISPPPELYR